MHGLGHRLWSDTRDVRTGWSDTSCQNIKRMPQSWYVVYGQRHRRTTCKVDPCECPNPSCIPRRLPAKDNTCSNQVVYPVAPKAPTTQQCKDALQAWCHTASPSGECAHARPSAECSPDKCWICVKAWKDNLFAKGCTTADFVSWCNYLSDSDADSMADRQCNKYFSKPLISLHNHVCRRGVNSSGRHDIGGWYPQGGPGGQLAWYKYSCENGNDC